MAWKQQPIPTPGHPIARDGKIYIWVTWLAKLLGGEQCVWKVWFLSRYRHAKQAEKNAEQLAEWNREHNQMMRERKALLEEEGWSVQTERDFKLEGQTAIIAGKEDLVATMPGHMLIVDGKTGRRRDSDFWQVLIYLYARLHAPVKHDDRIRLAGEVFYKQGKPIDVRVADVQRHEPALIQMVQAIASPTPPSRNPSRYECERCSIRREDCPDRYQAETSDELVHTDAF
jgi:hypothetical protein